MIIEMLLDGIYHVLDFLLAFEIPQLPAEVQTHISSALEYLQSACGIVNNYAPLGYLLILAGIIVSIDIAIGIYHMVMWVLRKIPVLGIE